MNDVLEAMVFTVAFLLVVVTLVTTWPVVVVLNSRRLLKKLKRRAFDEPARTKLGDMLSSSEPLLATSALLPFFSLVCVLSLASMLQVGEESLPVALVVLAASIVVMLLLMGYGWIVVRHWRPEVRKVSYEYAGSLVSRYARTGPVKVVQ